MALILDRRKFLQVSSAVTIGRWSSIAAAADPFLAMTTEGPVRGFLSKQARCFTGVPYGQAQRFAAPRCTPHRQGVFDASRPAALAPQLPGLLPFEGTIAEECLQLNVWAPVESRDRPVLVYRAMITLTPERSSTLAKSAGMASVMRTSISPSPQTIFPDLLLNFELSTNR